MTRPYAEVIGDPIAHSKSPLIHNFWLAKLGMDAEYRAERIDKERLPLHLMQRLRDPAWRGCNVTLPHKLAALRLVHDVSSDAATVGAINTVIAKGDDSYGYNTDVAGILEALPPSLMPPGAEVCLIGTGGAARAALAAFRQRDISLVLFSARNLAAATQLQNEFQFGGTVRPIDDAHNIQTAEVIVNATTLGMKGKDPMPAEVLKLLSDPMPEAVVFDMVYSPLETPLLLAARLNECRTVDGLQMLVAQAAAAFELFFGQSAPREHDAELRALLTA